MKFLCAEHGHTDQVEPCCQQAECLEFPPVRTEMKLAVQIEKFLKEYAGTVPDGDELEYTSPDAYQLEHAAKILRSGGKLLVLLWSEWGSGGYRPYSSKVGRAIHEDIMDSLRELVKGDHL